MYSIYENRINGYTGEDKNEDIFMNVYLCTSTMHRPVKVTFFVSNMPESTKNYQQTRKWNVNETCLIVGLIGCACPHCYCYYHLCVKMNSNTFISKSEHCSVSNNNEFVDNYFCLKYMAEIPTINTMFQNVLKSPTILQTAVVWL